MSNLHKAYITSAFGSVDLKIGMSKCTGARHFSFCLLLLQHLPLGASLTVEYPSESTPPLSGEDGGKFPGHSFAGQGLGGLPHGQLRSALVACPHPVSSTGPVLLAVGGTLPTNDGLESDSLEARLGTGLPGYSACDHCLHLSDATITQHQPSASGIGFTVKYVEQEIHSENSSPM